MAPDRLKVWVEGADKLSVDNPWSAPEDPAHLPGSAPGSEPDGEVPLWRRGWIQFRYEPTGLALKRATQSILILGLVIPLFALAALFDRPHLRSVGALVACLVLFAGVTVWNICELKAQNEGRFEWFQPKRSIVATWATIVEFGLFGVAFGIRGGVLLLMPCTIFLVAVLLGNIGMIATAWIVLVVTLGVESGVQVPAVEAVWLTVLFSGTAAIVALAMDRALKGSLYGVHRNQSLAVLASYAGTLRAWPEDLDPIASRLAEALDVDPYAIFTRQAGLLQPVLSWPDPDWPDPDQLGDLPARAADSNHWTSTGTFVATPSSAGGVDVVLVVPAMSVLHVPVDHTLLAAGVALLAAMCDRARLISWLVELASIDELTGIANRRRLFHALDNELSRGRKNNKTFSVAILDLDDFKSFNDRNGHIAGDRMLRRFSDGISGRIRSQDILARYGGEEFCLVLPETDGRGATQLVEAIRQQTVSEDTATTVTFSGGVAAWDGTESIDSVLLRADANLYKAKSAGRNRVVGID